MKRRQEYDANPLHLSEKLKSLWTINQQGQKTWPEQETLYAHAADGCQGGQAIWLTWSGDVGWRLYLGETSSGGESNNLRESVILQVWQSLVPGPSLVVLLKRNT